jgi:hypothetical protein
MSITFNSLGLAIAMALVGCSQPAPPAQSAALPKVITPAPTTAVVPARQLQAALRGIRHDHIAHARDYVIAKHAGDKSVASAAADAVVANTKQISEAVGGFYGKASGDQVMTLLGGHWGALKALTDARVAGDEAGASKTMSELNANAGEIAKFLAGANPNLPEDTVRGMMLAHAAHHAEQINLILKNDNAGEATEWAAMQAHTEMIADALAGAIANQFPDKAK